MRYIIIIIILVVIIGGGVLAYQNWWLPNQESEGEEPEESYIKLISPNGDEKWVKGKIYDIRWESNGVELVYILLRDKSIFADEKLLAKVNAETNQYSWEIPLDQETGDEFVISIEEAKSTSDHLYDESNNYFTILEDETANWQTYRNEEYSFEIKYPEDWQVDTSMLKIKKSASDSYFEIVKNENEKRLTLDEWFEEATIVDGRPTSKAVAKKISINGVEAYRLDSDLQSPNPLFEIVGIANSEKEIFSLYVYSGQLSDNTILEQILFTFRFIEEDETADWETYRNEEYGFEVKYPSEITISSYGPNVAQQAINRGEQISGTVTPSLDTVVFSDDGGQLGAIGIFHKTEKDLTINNYDDGYLYLSGPCDLRWGFHPDNISLTSINDVTALIAEGEMIIDEEVVSYNHCYYLKNPDENLIVISNSGYKEDIFSQMLSTFRFIETISVWPEVESFDLANKTFEGKIWTSEREVRILTTDSTKFYSTSAPNWEKEYWTFPEFYSLLQNWTGPLWPFTVEGIYEGENTLRADEVSLIAQ